MRNSRKWSWWIVGICLIAFTVSGCPKKTPPPPSGSEMGGPGEPGFGSQDLKEKGLAPSDSESRVRERISGEHDTSGGGPLQDVYFAYDSFDLSPEARAILQTDANWLKQNSGTKVEIEGHCDERGTVEYNLALGAKRAKAVRDYLVNLGVPAGQLSTISYGEELPVCHEATESCWQQNRRVHFLLVNR